MQLDGRRISSLFDTGAEFSVLSTRTARALGVSEAVLARDLAVTVRGADGEQLSAHAHCFFRREVDGEVIRNAEINVTEISLNDADFVLGIDFLGSRRVWISDGSQQLFLISRIRSAIAATPFHRTPIGRRYAAGLRRTSSVWTSLAGLGAPVAV